MQSRTLTLALTLALRDCLFVRDTQPKRIMKLPFQFASLVLCILLAACGGGGGGDPPAGASTVISGTVAAGAPVIGNVFVKDSTGAVRGPVAIEANGSYRIDVSGMTSPFLFRAEGSVGGREVVLASAATAADVGGTINVTPFTDLIVANVAGTVASRFYDSPNFARLTPAELDAARQTLTARLLPVLRELGVQDGFDLLRSAFTANHQGFDACYHTGRRYPLRALVVGGHAK